MTGKDLFAWLGIAHPDHSPDPQYWTRDDPADPDWCLTVGAWMDGSRLVAAVFEARWSPLSPRFGTRRHVFQLKAVPLACAMPGAAVVDEWRIESVFVFGQAVPMADPDALRRALVQFRDAVRTVQAGAVPLITAPESRTPGLGTPPGDDGGPGRNSTPEGKPRPETDAVVALAEPDDKKRRASGTRERKSRKRHPQPG